MKRLIARCLHDQTGDTLVEALVSILIAALSLLMLATAVGVASRMVSQSRESMAHHYAAANSLTDYSTSDAEGEVVTSSTSKVIITGGTDSSGRSVTLYEHTGFDGKPIISYEVAS